MHPNESVELTSIELHKLLHVQESGPITTEEYARLHALVAQNTRMWIIQLASV